MTEEKNKAAASRFLYEDFLIERDEILKHKWLQSEATGRDIGFEAALIDWYSHHRSAWKKEQLAKKRG